MEVKKDFSLAQIKIMADILFENKKDGELSITKLAKLIDVGVNNPKFYQVIRYLTEQEIIRLVKIIGSTKIIYIDDKALKNLLDEQDLVVFFYEYFHAYHYCSW